MARRAADSRVRSLQREAGPGVIEYHPCPGIDAMAGRARTEARGLSPVWIAVAIGTCRRRQPELHDLLFPGVAGIAWHGQVRTCQRELGPLMIVHTERRRNEALDGVAARTVGFQLTCMYVDVTPAASIEARELQRPRFRVTRAAFRRSMRAAQRETRLVMIEPGHVRERSRRMTTLA